MGSKVSTRSIVGPAVLALALLAFALGPYLPVARAETPPGNLIRNGMFERWVSWDNYTVAENWAPFVISGQVTFNRHGFELGQQLQSFGRPFVAGIYQQVGGAVPGATYYAYVGTASKYAADNSGRLDGHIGRTIGVDPYGGTDATSPNIVWGSETWSDAHWEWKDDPRANAPKVRAVAQGSTLTLFVKVTYINNDNEAKAWLMDAAMIQDTAVPIVPVQPAPPPPAPEPAPAEQPAPEAVGELAAAATFPVADLAGFRMEVCDVGEDGVTIQCREVIVAPAVVDYLEPEIMPVDEQAPVQAEVALPSPAQLAPETPAVAPVAAPPAPASGLQRIQDQNTATNPSSIQAHPDPVWYIPVLHQLNCAENHGMLRVRVVVLDQGGNPIDGVPVIVNTMDGAWPVKLITGDKGPGAIEYAFLTSNHTGGRWKVEIEGGQSDVALNLATDLPDELTPGCNQGNTRNHYSYDVTFRKAK